MALGEVLKNSFCSSYGSKSHNSITLERNLDGDSFVSAENSLSV